jgi:hypothetical protein
LARPALIERIDKPRNLTFRLVTDLRARTARGVTMYELSNYLIAPDQDWDFAALLMVAVGALLIVGKLHGHLNSTNSTAGKNRRSREA